MYNISAFKTYDIRGIRQKEIDEQFGYVMWFALAKEILKPDFKILIASDVRAANVQLIDAFLSGLSEWGVKSVTVLGDNTYDQYPYGICSTPVSYYVSHWEYDLTVIFSASHNSKEYVWLKIVNKESLFFPTTDLKKRFLQYDSQQYAKKSLPELKFYSWDKINNLKKIIWDRFKNLNHKVPSFVVDYGHGAAVCYEQSIMNSLFPGLAIGIFTNPDWEFPAHETDTSRFSNYASLIQTIQKHDCEFGFMFDGDADRMGIVLQDGKTITWDVLLAIVAKQLLTDWTSERLWTNVIYQEVFCGKIVREVVEKYGWELKITRVGRGAFVNEVIENNWLLAWEISVHMLLENLAPSRCQFWFSITYWKNPKTLDPLQRWWVFIADIIADRCCILLVKIKMRYWIPSKNNMIIESIGWLR